MVSESGTSGLCPAEFNLGAAYYHGEGVVQDYGQAVFWYQKAAEQGDAKAQTALGVAYITGRGVTKSRDNALIWIQKAADQGDVTAQKILPALKK